MHIYAPFVFRCGVLSRYFYSGLLYRHWGNRIITPTKVTLRNTKKNMSPGFINSLPPDVCGCDFIWVNFKHNVGVGVISVQVNTTMEWMSTDLVDGESTLVMACGCQVENSNITHHYNRLSVLLHRHSINWKQKRYQSSVFLGPQ